MKIVIFGGTTEGRKLSEELAASGAEVVTSVASEYGRSEQGEIPGVVVSEGRLDEAGMIELLSGADICVDATHPFALEARNNIKTAASSSETTYMRLVREGMLTEDSSNENARENILFVNSPEEAAEKAKELGGKVLLTTGVKDIRVYCARINPENIYPRVLPLVSSLEALDSAGIPPRNITAAQGPFSKEMNIALIKDYGIDILITKDSGKSGGLEEKLKAASESGITAIVIRRPDEKGKTYEEVRLSCLEMMKRR